ncbi:MAG TPA: sugar ABC transporter ATP-binding protein [Acidimicrobiales bacterium]|nr:sugar ABC transporter ATP-binding protein [Acidimicrobiales bacterium]
MPALLELHGVAKTFGGQRALIGVDLALDAGSIHALVGLNGSGKSTLVKLLAGVHAPDPGWSATIDGAPFPLGHPKAAQVAGLRFVHQDLGLVPELSVTDNFLLGRPYPLRHLGTIDWSAARAQARDALGGLGYDVDVTMPVARLTTAERTAVAIARAVSHGGSAAKVLVLDEPTAALTAGEVAQLFRILRDLRAQGLGVLLVSHHLEEVFEVSDTVTVLRDGARVATAATAALSEQDLLELLVGAPIDAASAAVRAPVHRGSRCLEVAGLSAAGISSVDLTVHAGEIVGVAGIAGSGRESLLPAIFGAAARQGVVRVRGEALPAERPGDAIRLGLGYLAGDRARTAVLDHMSVQENLTLPRIVTHARGMLIDRSREVNETGFWIDRLKVRPRSPRAVLTSCSGGNQQKVLLGRWLRLQPHALLADEPTQGIDIPSRLAVHHIIRRAADDGMSFLLCSADTEELAEVCHRVLVMRRGAVVAELSGDDVRRDTIDALSVAGERAHARG